MKRHSSASTSNPGERGPSAWVAHKGPQTGGQRFTHLALQLKQHTQKQDEDGAAEERRKGPGQGQIAEMGQGQLRAGRGISRRCCSPGGCWPVGVSGRLVIKSITKEGEQSRANTEKLLYAFFPLLGLSCYSL